MTNEKPLNIGIIGLGRAGWSIHFVALQNDPRYRITAIADPDEARRKEAADAVGCETFATIDELLAKADVEAVVVATPSQMHAPDAIKVLDAGKHCILEKPMALDYAEACRVVERAREKGLQVFVHHQHAFNNEYLHFQEIVESGILGPIFHLQTFWGGFNRRWDWQTLKKNGGGHMNNHCPHVLTIVLPLLGSDVTAVDADLRNIKNAGDAEDHVNMFIRTKSGATANILATTACALPAVRWILMGANGTLSSDGTTSKLRYFDPAKAPSLEVIDAAAPDRKYQSESLPWQEEERPTAPTQTKGKFYDNVFDVIRKGAPIHITPESALAIMQALELARESAERKASVNTP